MVNAANFESLEIARPAPAPAGAAPGGPPAVPPPVTSPMANLYSFVPLVCRRMTVLSPSVGARRYANQSPRSDNTGRRTFFHAAASVNSTGRWSGLAARKFAVPIKHAKLNEKRTMNRRRVIGLILSSFVATREAGLRMPVAARKIILVLAVSKGNSGAGLLKRKAEVK